MSLSEISIMRGAIPAVSQAVDYDGVPVNRNNASSQVRWTHDTLLKSSAKIAWLLSPSSGYPRHHLNCPDPSIPFGRGLPTDKTLGSGSLMTF